MASWMDNEYAGVVAFGLSIVFGSVYLTRKSEKPFVKGLYIYPIKSCRGMKVASAVITPRGFKYDRQFMVVGADGVFVTQRKYSRMALIEPIVLEQEGIMVITAPGMPELRVPLTAPQTGTVPVRVWTSTCDAEVVSEKANEWFSQFLEAKDLRLVRMCDDFVRRTEEEYAPNGQTAFADGFPFLIASEASLNTLNTKLSEQIPMDRFRPNILLGGCGAFAEDNWKTISLAGMTMAVVKPCSRCTIPNVDQLTGTSNPAPSAALKTFRTGSALGLDNPKWKREVFFGQNVDHAGQAGATVSVGQEVRVLA